MADDLQANPLVVDTTGVKTIQPIFVERIAWKNATAQGHTAQVVDNNGKLIWEHFAPGATANVSEPIMHIFNGLNVTALSSGKLYILVR
jgi:hypothetical protein